MSSDYDEQVDTSTDLRERVVTKEKFKAMNPILKYASLGDTQYEDREWRLRDYN